MAYNANISNLAKYNAEMRKSMFDKLFFLDKIEDVETIVDFGCANGDMINFMTELAPEYQYIGYDINQNELNLARKNAAQAEFFSDWDWLIEEIDTNKSALILSSVIHEIVSYNSSTDIYNFWTRIRESNFKYVVIREMCPDLEYIPSDKDRHAVTGIEPVDKILDWQAYYGDFRYGTSFLHYLLKYRYDDTPVQWKRELNENYFPYTKDEYFYKLPYYQVEYSRHYTLPFIAQQVKKDFGINLTAKTHLQIIYRK